MKALRTPNWRKPPSDLSLLLAQPARSFSCRRLIPPPFLFSSRSLRLVPPSVLPLALSVSLLSHQYSSHSVSPNQSSDSDCENVVVIGSGAAGLTAAIYTSRALLKPLVIEGSQPGGQLTITSDVENFPGFKDPVGGEELMGAMRSQAERFGARFNKSVVSSANLRVYPFEFELGDGTTVRSRSAIITTGAVANWLGCEGESEFQGKGVSSCATCDGFFFKGKDIAVVGGGDSAMEEATFLTRFAKHVYVVHRRDSLRASATMRQRALSNPKISFVWNAEVTQIKGNEKGKLNKIILKPTNGKQMENTELSVEGLFVAIGHKPNSEIFKGQIRMDEKGYITKNSEDTSTSVPGVFVAGDVADNKYRQAVTAAGMGCQAALDAQHWLEMKKHTTKK